MKKTLSTILLTVLAVLNANALEFGDIEAQTPLYVPGDASFDPFAIAVATNAYNKAMAETALRTAAIVAATNATTIAYLAAISDEATERINGDSANVALILATSNGLSSMASSLINAEASLRRSGDSASTNFTLSVSNSLRAISASYSAQSGKASTNFTLSVSNSLDNIISSKVPTNRTITFGNQIGSLQTNLVFASTDTGVTESTVTNIAQAVVTSNVPTLAQVALAGGFAGIETITPFNIVIGGYLKGSTGNGTNAIYNSSIGASQFGFCSGEQIIEDEAFGASQCGINMGYQKISTSSSGSRQLGVNGGFRMVGNSAFGATQSGYNSGEQTIESNAEGSSQLGRNEGFQGIGVYSFGATQKGYNLGIEVIGDASHGSIQTGATSYNSVATNNGIGAVQIFNLLTGQRAITTQEGSASFLLGAGTISNKNSIVAGDGECSHGDGSITAGGGFFGSALVIAGTNIQDSLNQRVEKSGGTATNLSVSGTLNLNGEQVISAAGVTNVAISLQQLFATNYYTKAEIDARPSSVPTIVKDVVISTNVVRVTSTQSVYVATVASPCVITQDVSTLTLATNQTAFWTTRINVTDWSATNGITFATNIAAYAGDFTVTGCYDFACSLLCDGRIEMRQTFPTVYEWQHLSSYTLSAATNASAIFSTFPKEDVLFIGLAHIKTLILAGYVYSIYYPAFTKSPGSSTPIDIKVFTNNTNTTDISIPYAGIFTQSDYLTNPNANSYGFSIRKLGTGDTSPHPIWQYMRRANELEIKAYNAGWRP